MPELPEVETARRLLERRLAGRRLAGIATVDDRIVYDGVLPRRFAAALKGRRVEAARRKGKHLWLELDRRPWPAFHFGMGGAFHVYEATNDRPRFWKVEMATEDGLRIAMTNPRRLGRIRLLHDPANEPPVSLLGHDPLHGLPPAAALADALARRHAPIKAVLLDQSLFAGVGNWIADEVLYQARLDPRRAASTLSREEVAALRSRLRAIVTKAVAVEADSDRFPRGWLFHVRWGKDPAARTADGRELQFLTLGGRTTAWVPSVQK